MEEYFSLAADDDDYESISEYTGMQSRDNKDTNNIDHLRTMMSFGNPINIGQSPTMSSFSNFGGLFGPNSGVWGDGTVSDKESISGMSTGANTSIANASVGNTSMGSTASHLGSSSTGSVGSNQWIRPTPPRPPPGFESYNSNPHRGGGTYHNENGTMLGPGPTGLSQSLPPAPGLSQELGLSSGFGQGLNRSITTSSSYSSSSLLSSNTIANSLLSPYDHIPLSHSQSHLMTRDMHVGDNHDIINNHLMNNNMIHHHHPTSTPTPTNHTTNHSIMEELLRLEIDHQQLQQEKMQQKQQQQQLLQHAQAKGASMSPIAPSVTNPAITNNHDNNPNNNNNNPSNNYDNIYQTTNSLISDNIAKRPSPHQLINPPSSPAKQLCAEQVLLSAASLLQNQIYRSVITTSKNKLPSADPMSIPTDISSLNSNNQGGSQTTKKTAFSEFNAIPSLPIDCGGPCHPSQISPVVLEREMNADESMYDEILIGRVPTIDTIHRFMCYLNHRAGFSTECNVIALMYVNRINLLKSAIPITTHSWRALWAICVIIAQKFWEPIPVRTSSFASILPSLSKELLRFLELKLLDHLGFNTTMEPEIYENYCQELRALFYTIRSNSEALEKSEWMLQPLTLVQAERMKNKANNVWVKPKDDVAGGTQGIGGGSMSSNSSMSSTISSKSQQKKQKQQLQQQQQQHQAAHSAASSFNRGNHNQGGLGNVGGGGYHKGLGASAGGYGPYPSSIPHSNMNTSGNMMSRHHLQQQQQRQQQQLHSYPYNIAGMNNHHLNQHNNNNNNNRQLHLNNNNLRSSMPMTHPLNTHLSNTHSRNTYSSSMYSTSPSLHPSLQSSLQLPPAPINSGTVAPSVQLAAAAFARRVAAANMNDDNNSIDNNSSMNENSSHHSGSGW